MQLVQLPFVSFSWLVCKMSQLDSTKILLLYVSSKTQMIIRHAKAGNDADELIEMRIRIQLILRFQTN